MQRFIGFTSKMLDEYMKTGNTVYVQKRREEIVRELNSFIHSDLCREDFLNDD